MLKTLDHTMKQVLDGIEFRIRRSKLKKKFKKIQGYDGNFENPRNYEEKIQFRKLYGNHEFYGLVADKYKVRHYVAERVGEKYLIPLLGVYEMLTPEIFRDLPDRFIIKANHGSKWNRIVYDKKQADLTELITYFNGILEQKYSRKTYEKHYEFIEPRIVIEELLLDKGELPWDYNVFSYNSQKGFDYALSIASPDLSAIGHFDKHWNPWEGTLSQEQTERYVNPKNSSEMIEIARALSADFDFVRVDLYNIDGKIYFGELTCTPGSGLGAMINEFRSTMRSEMWELDRNNTLLYRKPRGFIR